VGGNQGIKINELKDILGHASLSTTEKYLKSVPYGTSINDQVWDYIDKF
jgi:integrase